MNHFEVIVEGDRRYFCSAFSAEYAYEEYASRGMIVLEVNLLPIDINIIEESDI